MRDFLDRRVLEPLKAQLKRGLTPRKLAQSLAFGAVISCCPIFGSTTALCLAAGAVFGLNHVALQIVNYLFSPVQLALMIPFFRAGERLFGLSPAPLRPDEVLRLFRADVVAAVKAYGLLALRGTAAWLLVAPVAIVVLSRVLEPAVARLRPER
jgi:uncharacterized protein (DUF2062 family)